MNNRQVAVGRHLVKRQSKAWARESTGVLLIDDHMTKLISESIIAKSQCQSGKTHGNTFVIVILSVKHVLIVTKRSLQSDPDHVTAGPNQRNKKQGFPHHTCELAKVIAAVDRQCACWDRNKDSCCFLDMTFCFVMENF